MINKTVFNNLCAAITTFHMLFSVYTFGNVSFIAFTMKKSDVQKVSLHNQPFWPLFFFLL